MSKWIPKYPKWPGSRKEHDLEKVFNYLFNSVMTIRVITRTYKILWENIEQFSRNRGTYICQNEPIPWEEKFFNYFLVSVVTIRVIPTKVHENILNGSQETGTLLTWAPKYRKMTVSRGVHNICFGEVTIRLLLPSTSVHNFMIKHCTVL